MKQEVLLLHPRDSYMAWFMKERKWAIKQWLSTWSWLSWLDWWDDRPWKFYKRRRHIIRIKRGDTLKQS